ncbi:GrpE-domain-containing protein [Jimgerdemannia flammicorona]|uniref:GrpE protein homolog, mitochondrial n=1 Tax=Jimgerdemannia flammicorona TaxID=994334 RepID=A0A433CZM6_9FUNG|nr:GrpE-domain-containing protein [Jimgerdemannia flammicorona]
MNPVLRHSFLAKVSHKLLPALRPAVRYYSPAAWQPHRVANLPTFPSMPRVSLVPAITTPTLSACWSRYYATENNGGVKNEEPEGAGETKEGEAKAAPAENDKQPIDKDKQIAELRDAYLRCLAEQENIFARSRKEIEVKEEFAIRWFAKDIVETVDILDMALSSVPESLLKPDASASVDGVPATEALRNLFTGVSMTHSELLKTLKKYGIEKYNPINERFNPNLHQAMFQAPIPGKEVGTIFSVQKVGYIFKENVLRCPQVGVVTEAPAPAPAQ